MDPEQLRILEQFSNQLRLTTDELQDFKDSVKVLGPAFAKMLDPAGKFADQMKAAASQTEKKAKAEKDGTKATEDQTKAVTKNKNVTDALTEAQEELEESTEALKGAMGSLAKGAAATAVKFGDALLSSQQGVSKYGEAVGKAGDAALEIGSKFGILGTIIGGLIKAGTMVIEAQLKQADAQRSAIVELSKLGAAGQISSKQMIELSHAADIPIKRFNEFLGPLKSMGDAITAIGDNAKQSTENFAKFSNVGEKAREGFFKLGLTNQDLTQSMADYISLQKASGRVIKQQEIDNGQLQKAALRYTLQMQELSDLTGLELEQARKRMQETTNTIQMAVIGMQRSEKLGKMEEQLAAATKAGRTEEAAAIQKSIDLHKKQDTAMEDMNKAMAAIGGGGKEAGAAMQQFLADGGLSEEASRKFGQLGMDLEKYRQQMADGSFDQAQFMEEYRNAITKRVQAVGAGIVAAGAEAEKLAKDVGVSQEEILWAQANRTKNFAEEEEKRRKATAEALKGEGEVGADPMATNQARLAETERQMQIAAEAALDATNIMYQGTLPKFTDAAEKMTEMLNMLTVALGALLTVTGIKGIINVAKGAGKVLKGASDWFKSKKTPAIPTTTAPPKPTVPVGKDGKPLRGAALKSAEDKAARVAAEKAAEKAAKEAAEAAATKAATTAASAASPAANAAAKGAGMLGRAGAALGRFGKFIPGVGQVITAGLAAKGAYDAYQDVEGTMGGLREGQKATTGQKVAAGAAGALSSLTFGAIDAKTIGGFLNKTLGLGETEEEQAARIAEETIATDKSAQEYEVFDSLIKDLEGTKEPLDKFGSQLTDAKTPVQDFSETMKKANEMLSQSAFGGGAMSGMGSPFTMSRDAGFATRRSDFEREALMRELGLSGGAGGAGGGGGAAPAAAGGGAGGSGVPGSRSRGEGFLSRVLGMFGFGGEDVLPAGDTEGQGPTPGPDGKLLDFIAKYESRGNYNILVGGKTKTDPALTDMTVAEVLDFQKSMRGMGHETTALGKYQIIRGTLQGLVKRGVVGLDDKFDQSTQDKAAIGLLDIRGREKFKSGRIDANTYANNIAKEWASMPMPNGQSYYAGVGSNAAHADRQELMSSISARMGGIAKGPNSGYPATLHGSELIVPLDPNSILAELGKKSASQISSQMESIQNNVTATKDSSGMSDVLRQNQAMIEMLSDKLDSMIKHLDTSNDTQTKLLRYSQA